MNNFMAGFHLNRVAAKHSVYIPLLPAYSARINDFEREEYVTLLQLNRDRPKAQFGGPAKAARALP